MLINVTHLTALQDRVADVVDEYMNEIRNAADFALGYTQKTAIKKSTTIAEIYEIFHVLQILLS